MRAKHVSTCPVIHIGPKIVEYQSGSRDMIQSTAANETAKSAEHQPGR